MAVERVRPVPPVNQPTVEQTVQAEQATEQIDQVLNTALARAADLLAGIDNPLERARAAERLLHRLRDADVSGPAEMRRSAMLEAYRRGRQASGKYGFGALANDLGTMSKARVQQILTEDSTTASGARQARDQAGTLPTQS